MALQSIWLLLIVVQSTTGVDFQSCDQGPETPSIEREDSQFIGIDLGNASELHRFSSTNETVVHPEIRYGAYGLGSRHFSKIINIFRPHSVPIHLIDDNLAESLEYLGNGTDLQNFRKTCMHFNRIYDRYKVRQNAKFRGFELLFRDDARRNQYRSLDDLLDSVPMIPDVYVKFWTNEGLRWHRRHGRRNFTIPSDILRLIDLHRRSKRHVLRGLSSKVGFLSMLLWKDVDWGEHPILLITRVREGTLYTATCQGSKIPSVSKYSAKGLNELLRQKQVRLRGATDEEELWTVGKRRCSAHSRYAFCRRRGVRCFVRVICPVYLGIAIPYWCWRLIVLFG